MGEWILLLACVVVVLLVLLVLSLRDAQMARQQLWTVLDEMDKREDERRDRLFALIAHQEEWKEDIEQPQTQGVRWD